MEYRNVDLKAMARKYSSGDVDLFGQVETTAIPEDIEELSLGEIVDGKCQVREIQGDGKDK